MLHYRPRRFSVPLRFAPRKQPSRLRALAALGRLHNGALCKPAGGIKVRASSAGCLKACHCACFLRARAFAVLDGAAVLNPRARHARARPGTARGLRPREPPVLFPAPGRGANRAARGIEDAQGRGPQMPRAKRSTGRDAPTAPAPKARTKNSSRRSSKPPTSSRHQRRAPARASWCALPRAPSAHSARVM